jgi:hypothetical protein
LAPEQAIKRLSSHLSVGRVLTIDRLNKRNQSVSQPLADSISPIERYAEGTGTERRKGFHQQSVEEEDKQMKKSASSFTSRVEFYLLLPFALLCQCEKFWQLTQAEIFF